MPVVPFREPVWVQYNGFTFLAVRDQYGRWRRFFDNKLLAGELEFIRDQAMWEGLGK